MDPGRLYSPTRVLSRWAQTVGPAVAAGAFALTMSGCHAIVASASVEGDPVESAASLEIIRITGDMEAQRRHVWETFVRLTAPSPRGRLARPAFESWHGEEATFGEAAGSRDPGMRAFSRPPKVVEGNVPPTPGVPVIAYTLYNDAAFAHIRRHRLHRSANLARIQAGGREGERSVPDFPPESAVVKTVWWPVAADRATVLPVWDPDRNPARPEGNGYTSWNRVVLVEPPGGVTTAAPVSFGGRAFRGVRQVELEAFHWIRLDGTTASRLMQDQETQRAVWIALGRPLRAGDYLVLVGLNLMTREIEDWIWSAFWWHDRPDEGRSAAGRPRSVQAVWRNFLMEAAFDSEIPRARGGAARVAFNPWLEARFPDGGNGGGVVSNCMACHARASYPAVDFLPVTRGGSDLKGDPAFAAERTRTSFLWSLAIHSR